MGELIKVPVIVDEKVLQHIVSRDLILHKSAERVVEAETEIRGVEVEVHRDMVLIQGKVVNKIKYNSGKRGACFQIVDTYFDRLTSFPGCNTEMESDLELEIVKSNIYAGREGNSLHIRVYIRCFLRIFVWKNKRAVAGEGPLMEVKKVIAERSARKLLQERARTADNVCDIKNFRVKPAKNYYSMVIGKLFFRGFLNRELEYIDQDGISHRQTEVFPFELTFDIPEVESSVEVDYRVDIEEIKYDFFSREKMLIQKFLLEVSVDILKRTRLKLNPGTDAVVLLPEIVDGERRGKIQFCINEEGIESKYQSAR
ncbi:MAG: SPOCS domain-containing protein [Halanaerobiales bacterium]